MILSSLINVSTRGHAHARSWSDEVNVFGNGSSSRRRGCRAICPSALHWHDRLPHAELPVIAPAEEIVAGAGQDAAHLSRVARVAVPAEGCSHHHAPVHVPHYHGPVALRYDHHGVAGGALQVHRADVQQAVLRRGMGVGAGWEDGQR